MVPYTVEVAGEARSQRWIQDIFHNNCQQFARGLDVEDKRKRGVQKDAK